MADELETLQQLIAQRLQRLGRVGLARVCRTAYKIVLLQRTGGAGVRVLVCRDNKIGLPFVNIMPLVDGKALVEDSQSLRGVDRWSLDPIIATIEAAFETALKAARNG
jgi:hypothetical protein